MTRRRWKGLGLVLLLVISSNFAQGKGRQILGKPYYTRVNIWYARKDQILSTNYHTGQIIPMGTKVFIDEYGRDRIGFSVEGTAGFVLLKSKHSKRDSLDTLFDYHFTERDPLGPQEPIHTFSTVEKRNIADGTLAVGMRKDAVLMAYGYPPSHKTPKLSDLKWTYWVGRMGSFTIIFDGDGKVKDLGRYKKNDVNKR